MNFIVLYTNFSASVEIQVPDDGHVRLKNVVQSNIK